MSEKKEETKLLSLRNVGAFYWLKKSYLKRERFWALKDVSFDLYQGESLGIIGRNGAGKSTLLRLLAGIIKPDQGCFFNVNGCSIALLSLQIGFVDYLTGHENAVLSGLLLGMRKADIESKINRIKEFSELGDFFEKSISTYSSGMKARLGFSVAFQLDPDVLLVDEVLGVGDAEFREKSQRVMREKISSNKTIVMVSHSGPTIRQLCDRAVWIENGITQMEGAVHDTLEAYNKNFIRRATN
jgi:lipopolysaccharide transport system ATP-binding protein